MVVARRSRRNCGFRLGGDIDIHIGLARNGCKGKNGDAANITPLLFARVRWSELVVA